MFLRPSLRRWFFRPNIFWSKEILVRKKIEFTKYQISRFGLFILLSTVLGNSSGVETPYCSSPSASSVLWYWAGQVGDPGNYTKYAQSSKITFPALFCLTYYKKNIVNSIVAWYQILIFKPFKASNRKLRKLQCLLWLIFSEGYRRYLPLCLTSLVS